MPAGKCGRGLSAPILDMKVGKSWRARGPAIQANPPDPVVVLGAVLTIALLGRAASALPALRALAVDPSKLMREE